MCKGVGILLNVNFIFFGDEFDIGIRILLDGVWKVCKFLCIKVMIFWIYF